MPRMTKAERAAQERRQARNARRQERRRAVTSARQQYNTAFDRKARQMFPNSGETLSPRQTAAVNRALGKRGADLMAGAKITSTRGGSINVGKNE